METTNKALPFLFNVGALKENLLCIALICHYKEFQGWYMTIYLFLLFSARTVFTSRVWHFDFNMELSQFPSDFISSTLEQCESLLAKQTATDLSNSNLQVMKPVSGAVRGNAASGSVQQKQTQASALLAHQPVSQTLTPQHNQIWREDKLERELNP